jgi:hypothetical protein
MYECMYVCVCIWLQHQPNKLSVCAFFLNFTKLTVRLYVNVCPCIYDTGLGSEVALVSHALMDRCVLRGLRSRAAQQ